MSRLAGLRRIMRRNPDFILPSKVTTPHGAVVHDVSCRVYLPQNSNGRPYLECDLNRAQADLLVVPKFSIEGELETPNGSLSIRSDVVFTAGWVEERRVPRCTLPGEPMTLEISRRGADPDESVIQQGIFRLTPNRLLSPDLTSSVSHTGSVEMRVLREVAVQLNLGTIHFRRHFRHIKKRAVVVRTDELVAELDQELERARLNEFVEELDDILLLTSLVTRHFCLCRSWTLVMANCETAFYRDQMIAPKDRRMSSQEMLVDETGFEEFLNHAFSVLRQSAGREEIRQAINLLVSSQDGTIEASFLKCFAALETLLNVFRAKEGLVTVLDQASWTAFERDLKTFIKKHVLFSNDKGRRQLVYEKRSELNRVAFGTAYRRCAESLGKYGFRDDDLWPVVGTSEGPSLAEIRNQIVHGVVFSMPQEEALLKSLFHLRWCVERMVLAFLEWPLERSHVGDFLRHMTAYQTWKKSRELFAAEELRDRS